MASNLPPNMPPSAGSKPPTATAFRRFLTRGEAATLIGMLMVIFSLYLIWEYHAVEAGPLPAVSGLFAELKPIPRTGQALPKSIRWTLIGSALLCGALLLWPPNEKTRLPLAVLNGACGLACVIIPLSWLARFGLQPGIAVALLGGILLVFGALERLNALSKPASAP
ncbi:MAG TPA: hypothetical protein VFB38_17795 [Chthonomonadaceae bacterium]|nr:hypothetical protein [Chthonomonadaceae bacterium]